MNKIKKYFNKFKIFNKKQSNHLLLVLLAIDLLFIVLHFVILLNKNLKNYQFSLEMDRGYPELFQYVKWLMIISLFVIISIRKKSLRYVSWILVFAYFFIDDAFQIHEQVGEYLAFEWWSHLIPPFGLRLEDFGEMTASASAGTILMLSLLAALYRASEYFKKISQDILFLILLLVFFGIFVDTAHVAIKLGWKVNFLLGAIEDGGEMIVVSFMNWYAFFQLKNNRDDKIFILDTLRDR